MGKTATTTAAGSPLGATTGYCGGSCGCLCTEAPTTMMISCRSRCTMATFPHPQQLLLLRHCQPRQSSSLFILLHQQLLHQQHQQQFQQLQQVRSMGTTKQRKKRYERHFQRKIMKEVGIPVRKPFKYIDPKTPVINAVPREEQNRRIMERRKNETLLIPTDNDSDGSNPFHRKTVLDTNGNPIPQLVHAFQTSIQETKTPLTMNSKVAKVLALANSTQQRVVQAQKLAGMQLFQMRPGDTGSTSVQIIALTSRIQQMDTHMIMHPKDKSGKRGLIILRCRRRKLLDYLQRTDFPSYAKVLTTLGLG